VVLNQVPENAGEDYGYYTRNYEYYSQRAASGGSRSPAAPVASNVPGKDRIRLREDDRS